MKVLNPPNVLPDKKSEQTTLLERFLQKDNIPKIVDYLYFDLPSQETRKIDMLIEQDEEIFELFDGLTNYQMKTGIKKQELLDVISKCKCYKD